MTAFAFKPHLRVSVIPGEGVLLLSDQRAWTLTGRVYELLAPLIDGNRDVEQLVLALSSDVEQATVRRAVELLELGGHIGAGVEGPAEETFAFLQSLDSIEPRAAAAALESTSCWVRAVGGVDPEPLRTALATFGVTFADSEEGANLEAVVTDDYLRCDLTAINAASLAAGRAWLLAKPVGHEPWIGPLFVPGRSACYECLAQRLGRNRPAHKFVATRGIDTQTSAKAAIPAVIGAASQLAAVEILKFIAGVGVGLQDRLLSLGLSTWKTVEHHLHRNPACYACGDTDDARCDPPLEADIAHLVDHRATHVQDCGYRTRSPEETLEAFQHLVSPITGLVPTLVTAHDADSPAKVYVSSYHSAGEVANLASLRTELHVKASNGKGLRAAQAKVSALFEAIERYSSERRGSEPVLTASFNEMRTQFGLDAIHPNDVMGYSDRQFAEREQSNGTLSPYSVVPELLDPSKQIDWTQVWSMTNERPKYLPTQLLYLRSSAAARLDRIYCIACTNGNSCGNNVEEAILHGLCELVERDAMAIWWYNRIRRPQIDISSFGDGYSSDLTTHYHRLGREIWALDISTEINIPVFIAVSRSIHHRDENILFGAGCHPDAHVALQRAFTEMHQLVSLALDEDGHVCLDSRDDDVSAWLRQATLKRQPYLAPAEEKRHRALGDYAPHLTNSLLINISNCRRLIEAQGLEVLLLDQTRPDVGVPTVKVVVPGLRHVGARFAPGRLYGVPVQMGWLTTALTEKELNPVLFPY